MQLFDEKTLKNRMGKLISAKRKSLNFSQEVLAEKLGVHVRTLSKIENGHTFISAETLCKLGEIFDLPLKAFFEIEDSVSINEQNLNAIIDKLRFGGEAKIKYYLDIINVIDKKFDE